MYEDYPDTEFTAASDNLESLGNIEGLGVLKLIPLPVTLALGEQMEPGVSYTPRITIPR